jgi:hypothetical protein
MLIESYSRFRYGVTQRRKISDWLMPPRDDSLDRRFGTCVDAGSVSTCEQTLLPVSMIEFNPDSAKKLKALFELADRDLYLSHCLYSEFTLL